jgi:hypothetical protein
MDIRAKRHSLLENLKRDLSKGFVEKEVTIDGHRYRLHTLNEEEESWVDAHVPMNATIASFTQKRAPRVAVALTHIDSLATHELFTYPDSMSKEQKDVLENDQESKKLWLREQVLLFICEEGNRGFVNKLNDELLTMEKSLVKEAVETKNL